MGKGKAFKRLISFKPWTILIPLICLALVLSTACTPKVEYQPTGDELYDRFAQLVLDQFAEHGYHLNTPGTYNGGSWSWQHEPGEMDLSAITEWEQDFGDDPRYWQLRAVCRIDELSTSTQVGQDWIAGFDSILKRKTDSGIYDRATFSVLPLKRMLKLDEWEDRALGYIDQAIAVDPDNAYWYYKQAEAYIPFGEIELAWDSVRAGNAAPRNEYVSPFPLLTLSDPQYRNTARGNLIVAGVVFNLELANMPNFIRTKDKYKNICVCTALGTPLQMADDWLTMARRFGQMEGAGVIYPLVGASCADVLVEYISTQSLDVPDGDLERLAVMRQLVEQLQERTPNIYDDYGELFAPGMVATRYSTALAGYGSYDPSGGIVVPDMIGQDWVNYALINEYEQDLVQELSSELDILYPSPFAAWAEVAGTAPATE